MTCTTKYIDCLQCDKSCLCKYYDTVLQIAGISSEFSFRCIYKENKKPISTKTTKKALSETALSVSSQIPAQVFLNSEQQNNVPDDIRIKKILERSKKAKEFMKDENDFPKTVKGICSVCNKKTDVVKCGRCGKEVCLQHCEIEEDISSGKPIDTYVCRNCEDDA